MARLWVCEINYRHVTSLFLVNRCDLVYEDTFRFKYNEGAFYIQPLSAVGAGRLGRVRPRELRYLFQGRPETSPFYPVCQRRPAGECIDGNRRSDADRSARSPRSAW